MMVDVPMSAYINDELGNEAPTANASVLKTLDHATPLHAWASHPRLGGLPQVHTPETGIGTAVHQMLLGGDDMIDVHQVDDWRTKLAKAAKAQSIAEGRIPLKTTEYEQAREVADRATEGLLQCGIDFSDPGHKESTVIWRSENGVWCRCRPDWMSEDYGTIIDVKTTYDASLKAITRTAINMAWPLSVAHTLDAAVAIGGRAPRYLFAVVERDPPYAVAVYELDAVLSDIGELARRRSLERWAECLRQNTWPGYATSIMPIECPGWMEGAHMAEREAEGARELAEFERQNSMPERLE